MILLDGFFGLLSAGLIIGFSGIILSVISCCVKLKANLSSTSSWYDEENDKKYSLETVLIAISLFLVWGTIQRIHWLLFPWLIMIPCYLIILIFSGIVEMVCTIAFYNSYYSIREAGNCLFTLFLFLFFLSAGVYFWIVIYWLCNEMSIAE